MSLFDSASLVVTPSGYKEDKLYSIKPTDGSGDLVVTRATTATRVNSDGLIEVVPYNLFTYSEQFNNGAWTKTNATITANATTAPNGTLTADLLACNTSTVGTNYVRQYKVISDTAHTLSFYAKANSSSIVKIAEAAYTGQELDFDLSNNTISGSGSQVSGTITDAGNGWKKITFTYVYTSGQTDCYLNINSTSCYIWGAQLNSGSSAKEYFPTTDRLDIPRLDYTNSSCPSILVEPQRTNLATYSEQFDNANWVKLNSTITANTSVAPTGNTTADTLTITSGGYLLQTLFGYNAVSGQSITISIFAKNQITNFLTFGGATLAGTDVYTIQDYGNGWYRHITTRTFSVTNASAIIQFIIFNQIGTHIVWGAQIEAGSYATSYIPTIASSVTRNADVISKTGISSLIGQTEGTVFVDINVDLSYTQVDMRFINVSDGTSTNWWFIGTNVSNQIRFYFRASGTVYVSELVTLTSGRHKLAFAYKSNDYVAYVDGIQVYSLNSLIVGATSRIDLGNDFSGGKAAKQFINSAILFKERLTNSELAQLTTI